MKLIDANKKSANPDDPLDPEFDISILGELDLMDPAEPNIEEDLEFFGFEDPDLDDGMIEIDINPPEPDIDDVFDIEIDIELELELEFPDLELELDDSELILETDTFGSIFTDGFEPDNTAPWQASSPDTMKFRVTSPDPNVRFVIVGLDPVPPPAKLPELKIVRRLPANRGKVALQFDSVAGQQYTIESSPDLQNFTTLTSLTGNGDALEFVDPASQTQAFRYYRLLAQ